MEKDTIATSTYTANTDIITIAIIIQEASRNILTEPNTLSTPNIQNTTNIIGVNHPVDT
ncbi:MAG: hypothetical protein NVSMB54_00700 [Ktedonobacteraceae bacterium]